MKYLGDPQSGSRANVVASRNRYGQYYRNRITPVNPSSTPQTIVRTLLAQASQSWSTLSAGDRGSWESYALAHPRTDSLGSSYTLSGQAAYVGSYVALSAAGLAPLTAPVLVTADAYSLDHTLTAAAGTPTLSLAFTVPNAGYTSTVEVSPPRPPGWSFNNRWVQIAVETSAGTSPASLLTAYTAIFGTLVAGQRIFTRLTSRDANGLKTGSVEKSWLIAA